VLIEAVIAEVQLTDEFKLGVEFKSNGSLGSYRSSISTIGGLELGEAGLNVKLFKGIDLRAQLNAFANDQNVKILSSPRLLALDNEAARIQIGTQLQVVSSESQNESAPSGDIVRTFQSVETGVILEIVPTINEGGLVQLEITQEVSDAGDNPGTSPPILKRIVSTKMVAKSGETVLIGGLISHTETETENKVPLLGDIPLLGYLFKSTSKREVAQEMIILITPHIVSGYEDAEFLTQAFKEKINWRVYQP
jgi:general secretion pathway protein D